MLTFERVNFSYRGRSALDNLTFAAAAGVTGLLGVNGAGKTTALRLAVGELKPHSGTVRVRDPAEGPPGVVGYCPQEVSFPKALSVIELFDYLAWLKKIASSARRAAVSEALDWADLHDRKNDRLGSLSGGMIRRVAIAQALIGSPSLVLLDEPTTGLDAEQRVRIRALLKTVPSRVTILMSSHLVEDVEALARETFVLSAGRLIGQTTDEALKLSGQTMEQYFLGAIASAG